MFSAPKIPKPPLPAQFQQMKLPDNGSTNNTVDDQIRRRRAMAATQYTGAFAGLAPTTTQTVLGG